MNLTGLLLGAGASYDLAVPLARELTAELKRSLTPAKLRELNDAWRRKGFGYSSEAIAALSHILVIDEMDYEHVMGNLELPCAWDRAKENYQLLQILSEMVYLLLKDNHVRNAEFIERGLHYLDGIATLVKVNQPLWVFSLNHDLIMECFCAASGIPVKSGHGGEIVSLPTRDSADVQAGTLQARTLRSDQLDSGMADFFSIGQLGINLLKIHGSLDEFSLNHGHDLLKLVPTNEGVRGVISTLQAANAQVRFVDPRFPGGRVPGFNEIIYEDERGVPQILRRTLLGGVFKFYSADTQIVPVALLKQFKTDLEHLTRLVTIGYGFRDLHVDQAIRDWLELGRDRQLVIVDPKRDMVPSTTVALVMKVSEGVSGSDIAWPGPGAAVSIPTSDGQGRTATGQPQQPAQQPSDLGHGQWDEFSHEPIPFYRRHRRHRTGLPPERHGPAWPG